mgnify:CR=1 FL=1
MRYSDYLNKIVVKHSTISYNLLTPKAKNGDISSLRPKKIEVNPSQAFRLLFPYCYSRVLEQVKSVAPLVAYLMLFQVLVLRQPIESAFALSGGIVAVIVGLTELSCPLYPTSHLNLSFSVFIIFKFKFFSSQG